MRAELLHDGWKGMAAIAAGPRTTALLGGAHMPSSPRGSSGAQQMPVRLRACHHFVITGLRNSPIRRSTDPHEVALDSSRSLAVPGQTVTEEHWTPRLLREFKSPLRHDLTRAHALVSAVFGSGARPRIDPLSLVCHHRPLAGRPSIEGRGGISRAAPDRHLRVIAGSP